MSLVPDAASRLETPAAGLSPPIPQAPWWRRWRSLFLLLTLLALAAAAVWLWRAHEVRSEWLQAEAALKRFDLAAAAAHLDNYLGQKPDDADAWFLAGRTARRLQRYANAEQYLKRCQELAGVTEATRLEWDLFRVQQGDLNDVDKRLRMTTTPQHPEALLVLEALARGYLKCDRLRDAMDACSLWLERQPEHPWPWLWRGGIFEQLGNYDYAMEDYQRAFDRTPDDRDVRLAIGSLHARSRQPGSAAEHFEFLLERSGDDEEARLGLAACRIEQGRPKDALALLEACGTEPVPPRALFLRGKAALEQLDHAGAERWLSLALQREPNNPETMHQLILALRAQGKQAEADRLAVRLEGLHKDLARLAEVIRSIGRDPSDVRPWHEAGVLTLRLGRVDEGVRWLQGALRVRPDHRPTHAALAEHFRRQGDPRADYHERLAQTP